MNEPPSSGSGQDFDVFSVMDWKDGIGTLPGSDLKFRVNEFGALEVITDETEMEGVKKATATTTWMVPTAQEAFSEKTEGPPKLKETAKVDGLNFCENCFHSGTTEAFVAEEKFFRQTCAQETKNKEQEEDKDVSELNGEDSSKGTQKRKTKSPLKGDCEDRHEKEEEMEEKPEGRILRVSQRAIRKRKRDMAILKQTLMSKGKKAWSWSSYLEEEKAIAAPPKIFKEYQSIPYNKNGFKVGMKVEGVDPEHQSVYCVLTVAEVSGYRIRLHFDEYSDCYDFWVNADSSDIHPVGWCEKTGHKLHPPKGYKEDEFNWSSYLKKCKAQAAPKSLFENQNTTVIPSGFRVGMKLEAVDKKNPAFICVATVTDMVDNRFLVHFDNWDESYDYCGCHELYSLFIRISIDIWPLIVAVQQCAVARCEAASPHIHPIGWCKEHKRTLVTPPDYPHAKHFSWEKYLEETCSLPAPARAFKVKPSHGFQKHMKLEVVDKRNPVLIRVATVVDTDDHRIKVHFDGWDSIYDYWIDADSPDIHPVGWCGKTGHPLQPPLSPLELVEALEQGGCPTAGCKGVGHIKRARHMGHHSAVSCPYSEINLNKEKILSDRLNEEIPLNNPSMHWNRKLEINETAASSVIKGCQPAKEIATKDEAEKMESENETKDMKESSIKRSHPQAVVFSSKLTVPGLPLRWEQQSKLLPKVAGIPANKVSKWSTDEVSEFVRSLPGCEEHGKVFKDEQIDGEAFLLMTQADIVKIMSIKLGPALKIFNSILMFKAADKNSHNEL
ncbi:lethal(3)malignant brain tumor-like protein 3 isoform X2 [Hemicordylus capensis]|nr:lethal(3)malignant brain tumor-like protein 3 isoform X2 [Hemicordylus capensis]XP_053142358.1 lethal(3)malignant brain tumor-like protein 3 isoform X2 [Hemicordylus capensis]XP_053142367.1 lethal(3)malignant brain tumor-like protein 3 isoform X2 [Hemicordylus capensis]XP_053142374.1 lethal(3)malignant brain tumor-like protein 3 isoform X2 [Hemicordylus capensis]XP_053142382.1 lethal(3)malignant brain tumor-like protein 3 isoform X2 [Hemicordylus capensis]XP_053142393.1 lethal(3)malignant b